MFLKKNIINADWVVEFIELCNDAKKRKKKRKEKFTYCNVGVIPATAYGLASLLGVGASNGAGVEGNANGVEL